MPTSAPAAYLGWPSGQAILSGVSRQARRRGRLCARGGFAGRRMLFARMIAARLCGRNGVARKELGRLVCTTQLVRKHDQFFSGITAACEKTRPAFSGITAACEKTRPVFSGITGCFVDALAAQAYLASQQQTAGLQQGAIPAQGAGLQQPAGRWASVPLRLYLEAERQEARRLKRRAFSGFRGCYLRQHWLTFLAPPGSGGATRSSPSAGTGEKKRLQAA